MCQAPTTLSAPPKAKTGNTTNVAVSALPTPDPEASSDVGSSSSTSGPSHSTMETHKALSTTSSIATSVARALSSTNVKLEELKDVIRMMKHQEKTSYIRKKKVSSEQKDEEHQDGSVQDPWRPLMVSWMFSMIDIFKLVPEIASTAAWYLDNVTGLIRSPSDYQLAGLTALCMAMKVHETRVFPLQQLVSIGNSGIAADDVIAMEQKMLKHLNWKLHPPTSECFLYQYKELLPEQYRESVLQASLGCIRKGLIEDCQFDNSVLAYAGMLVALEAANVPDQLKQSFGWNMMRIAEITAYTPGLAEAFKMLAPKPEVEATRCETPPPVETSESCDESISEFSHQGISISCSDDGDGFEVTWCAREHKENVQEGTISPRSVEM